MNHTEQVVLHLMHTPKFGEKTIAKVLTWVQEQGVPIDCFIQHEPEALQTGWKAISPETLEQGRQKAKDLPEQLESHGIEMLILGAVNHPAARFAPFPAIVPPVVFSRGNHTLLELPSVAFAGSRNASPKGIEITVACVKQLVLQSVNIISGYANGVDLTAHQTALEQGGRTTLVLAEGILRFKAKPSLAAVFREKQALILSQFPPRMSGEPNLTELREVLASRKTIAPPTEQGELFG
jgi:predicted Rossmann fold nucleotide-binding protein DprA/Smf involved in DNA uptake